MTRRRINYPAVAKRVEAGETVKAIAYEFGVTTEAISQGVRRHGWTRDLRFRGKPLKLSNEEIERRLNSGELKKVVAYDAGASRSVISRFAARFGCPVRVRRRSHSDQLQAAE